MIENIRKYTGLMIVVFALLFVSFLLIDTSSVQSIGGGGTVIRVDGRSFNQKDYRRIGSNGYDLAQQLLRGGDFGVYQFLIAAAGDGADDNARIRNFFVTRVLLRDAAEEFGVLPGQDEISTRMRSMRPFTGPDGDFDAQAYGRFIERGIGRLGMTEGDVRDLVSDVLIFEKIGDIVGAGLAPTRGTVERTTAFSNQSISGSLARIDLAQYDEEIDPTEEEIREFWENLRDAFTTEPRRRFTYILASPEMPEDEPEEDEPAETLAEAAMTTAQRAARDAEREEERARKAAERADARRKLQLKTDALVDDFLYELEQQKGATFEQLAKEMGLEVHTTELFPLSEPPEQLAVSLRQSDRGGTAADALFRMVTTPDPFSKISPPLPAADTNWIVARLDEIEPSRPKEYAEARDEARALLIEEQATQAMTKAAETARESIAAAIADGRTFAEAAAAAGLEHVQAFEDITSLHRPEPGNEPSDFFERARTVTPGTLADVIIEADRAFILYVAKREVVREENAAQRVDAELANTTSSNQTTAFVAWLRARTQAAQVRMP